MHVLESNKVACLGHLDALQHALSPYLNLLLGLGGGRGLAAQYLECVLKKDAAVAQRAGKVGVPDHLVLVLSDAELSIKRLLEQVGQHGVAVNAHEVRLGVEHALQEGKACIEEQWLRGHGGDEVGAEDSGRGETGENCPCLGDVRLWLVGKEVVG